MRIEQFWVLRSLSARVTLLLVALVTVSIGMIAALSFLTIFETTAKNANIRIDRAARTASALLQRARPNSFEVETDEAGRPISIHIMDGDLTHSLSYNDEYDALLREIGQINQGAANLFKFNEKTGLFDRTVTTFRTPEGAMPPPVSIGPEHPAYSALSKKVLYTGEVPVMGRMRLAYLTPILAVDGAIAGALAVDVGWVDDLFVARSKLQMQVFGVSAALLILMLIFGRILMHREMQPLRDISDYANNLANGVQTAGLPFRDRTDEVGDVARGLAKVEEFQKILEALAFYDPVSGLGNREKLVRDIGKILELSNTGTILLNWSFDDFSRLTAIFGASSGESVLREISNRLTKFLQYDEAAYRLSADNFCALVSCEAKHLGVSERHRIEALFEILSKAYVFPTGEVHLVPKMGIALLQKAEGDPEFAIRQSAVAMRASQKAERTNVIEFSDELDAEELHLVHLESLLRSAIQSDGLKLVYQAQVDIADVRPNGVEALVRLPDGSGGYISPAKFIPIAEKTGLIVELGRWVVRESCRQARKWRDAGFDFGHVSVNVSPAQFWQDDFVELIKQSICAAEIPASALCLEVTESIFIGSSNDDVRLILDKLSLLGVQIALDDFGVGYSSLSYLNQLRFHQLKIDKSFIAKIEFDRQKQELLGAIVGLGRAVGLKVIAEGVETARQAQVVQQEGCDSIQGYFYCKPVPADDVAGAIARGETALKNIQN